MSKKNCNNFYLDKPEEEFDKYAEILYHNPGHDRLRSAIILFLQHIFKLPNSLFLCCYDDKITFQQGVCWGEARRLSHWRRM